MCRSIKTLRTPEGQPTPDEFHAAALQFIRKISGYRVPSKANDEVFNEAVADVAAISARLLSSLKTRVAVSSQS